MGTVDPLEELMDVLCARPPVLVGCIRRNVWVGWDEEKYWRMNALLHCIGQRCEVHYPLGSFTVWVRTNSEGAYDLLQIRGGRYKNYWEQDCNNIAALVNAYTDFDVIGTLLLHEFDNAIRVRYYACPANAQAVVNGLMEIYHSGTKESPVRITKDSQRGRIYCYRCPVRKRCEAKDIELGEILDWPHRGEYAEK